MPRPTTKAALLAASEGGMDRLLTAIEGLPADVREVDFSVAGLFTKVRDIVCHLHEWHRLMLGWYEVGMGGGKPQIPAPSHTWRTTPLLNAELWKTHLTTSLAEGIKLLRQSHGQVQGLIQAHTDDELFMKGRYSWTGSTSLGAYLVSCTSSHYEWGLKRIKGFAKAAVNVRGANIDP